jgi:hypothetical protein
MGIQLKNNAFGFLQSAISNSDTLIVLQSGYGANFPTLGAGEYFYATISPTSGASEIVRVTTRTGDVLTVVRAQEGTSAISFTAGSRIELRVTAASVRDLVAEHDQAAEITIVDAGNYYSSGNVEGALQEAALATTTRFVQAGAGATTRSVQAKLRETVSVKDFGAVGDGVTNDTVAINAALSSGAKKISGVGGTYLITAALTVPTGVLFDGENGEIITNSLVNCIFANESSEICNWTVRSATPGVRKGVYGVSVVESAKNAFVHDCYFKDLSFNAVDVQADDVRVFDVVAENCGWDLVSTFKTGFTGPSRINVHRCHAIRTGRHGFSTNAGSKDVIFEDCIATDIGDPGLDEGKNPYHFEKCIRTTVKNCVANYTANHPSVSSASVNAFNAFREDESKECVVDGLIVNVESGFTPIGGSWRLLLVEIATENLVVRGVKMFNKSNQTFSIIWGNNNAQEVLEFSDFDIQGRHQWIQLGNNSGPRRISNGSFIGTGVETSIENIYITKDIEYSNLSFKNVANAIVAKGFQDSKISNCRFQTISGICLDLNQLDNSSIYRPNGGMVSENHFSGTIGTIIRLTNNFSKPTVFTQNIVDGAATTGLVASSLTNLLAYDNYVTGSVTTPQSGSSTSSVLTAELNNFINEWITVVSASGNLAVGTTFAQSPWTTQGRNEQRVNALVRSYKVNGYNSSIDDNTAFDTITITSPGGFLNAADTAMVCGRLRVTFTGVNTSFELLSSSRVYLVTARQQSTGNIALTATSIAAESVDSGIVTPTIVVQAKAGATATSGVIEASITFANFNSTFKPVCVWSFECDSITNATELFSLLKVQ